MKKFEYIKIVSKDPNIDELNKLGLNHWKICASYTQYKPKEGMVVVLILQKEIIPFDMLKNILDLEDKSVIHPKRPTGNVFIEGLTSPVPDIPNPPDPPPKRQIIERLFKTNPPKIEKKDIVKPTPPEDRIIKQGDPSIKEKK